MSSDFFERTNVGFPTTQRMSRQAKDKFRSTEFFPTRAKHSRKYASGEKLVFPRTRGVQNQIIQIKPSANVFPARKAFSRLIGALDQTIESIFAHEIFLQNRKGRSENLQTFPRLRHAPYCAARFPCTKIFSAMWPKIRRCRQVSPHARAFSACPVLGSNGKEVPLPRMRGTLRRLRQ